MADGRRKKEPEIGLGEGLVFGAALGGLLGAAYLIGSKLFDNGNSEQSNARPIAPKVSNYQLESENEEEEMILSVDATPTKGGAVLRLPKHKRVYYYSIDWRSQLTFPDGPQNQEPDRFEMVNTLIALVVFQPYLQSFWYSYDKLICKTDSSFYKARHYGHRSPDDQRLLNDIKARLGTFQGEFQEASQQSDNDMYNANQLSRNGNIALRRYESYSLQSVTVSGNWNEILEIVPRKYHTNFN